MNIGCKVTYIPKQEAGIIKEICKDGINVFVVYNCTKDWNNFRNYTGARTPLSDLRKGWT